MTNLRLWPGVAAVAVQWFLWLLLPAIRPEAFIIGLLGALLCGGLVALWWAFFSRAPRLERFGVLLFLIVAVVAFRQVLHPSIATGMMGMMYFIYVIPPLSLALVAWAVGAQRLDRVPRLAMLALLVLLAGGSFALLRTDGMSGEGRSYLAWRWTPDAEQRLLAAAPVEPVAAPAVESGPSWPGFRGPNRDSSVSGIRIQTDWKTSPPEEIWRRAVGPGWSSFAVGGGRAYTQEQRGDSEVVACYDLKTGRPIWTHRDAARFWESNGGAGPRGTPTLDGDRIYALGATGILNALDARSGAVLWTRNAASDTGAKQPEWGFAGSPLAFGDALFVATSGRLASYDVSSGKLRWTVAGGGGSYSSPHLLTVGGVPQVVLPTGAGAVSVAPADGKILWKHEWPGVTILQPAMTAEGELLLTTADASGGLGTRRFALSRAAERWTGQEVWTSRGLKPYFSDFVVHNGHAFGFDGAILSCIDLKDGQRKWKGGRFGHGQMLLLRDQDLLLVLSEEGEIALVAAATDRFTEIARMPAMDDKTWNHPVLAGDILLVRNGREMVAFRLKLAGS